MDSMSATHLFVAVILRVLMKSVLLIAKNIRATTLYWCFGALLMARVEITESCTGDETVRITNEGM